MDVKTKQHATYSAAKLVTVLFAANCLLQIGATTQCYRHGCVCMVCQAAHKPVTCCCLRALQLPDTGCAPQVLLLQTFQQLVELRESGRVLADVHQQQRSDQQYSDTKDILETWRWDARGWGEGGLCLVYALTCFLAFMFGCVRVSCCLACWYSPPGVGNTPQSVYGD